MLNAIQRVQGSAAGVVRGYTARDPEWTQNALLGAITNLAQCGIRDALELKARALRSLQAAAAREPRVRGRITWSAAGLNCTSASDQPYPA